MVRGQFGGQLLDLLPYRFDLVAVQVGEAVRGRRPGAGS
jgi:hypothetical protein